MKAAIAVKSPFSQSALFGFTTDTFGLLDPGKIVCSRQPRPSRGASAASIRRICSPVTMALSTF